MVRVVVKFPIRQGVSSQYGCDRRSSASVTDITVGHMNIRI
jgi:hypothetical protein